MNCIKKSLVCVAAATSTMFATATPEVSNVTMAQSAAGRLVTITYKLTEDAVVTLDVLTNATPNAATGWASIGGKAVCNAQGAVWRKVTSADADGNGNYTIKWRPDNSWTDEFGNGFKIADGCAKAVVTAYALDNTPDYMVVDISAGAQQNTQKYYPSVDFLPGGLLGKDEYRTTKLVMRKIMAKDVEWTMGSTTMEPGRNAQREKSHSATLTNNYYIGVFEITQTQWDLIQTARPAPSYFNNVAYRAMRPVEGVCYNEIRNAAGNTTDANTAYDWPEDPNPSSFLGLLYQRTGIKFDLPTEAEWEFAARAGNGDTKWGDGSAILGGDTDINMDRLGRNQNNGGSSSSQAATDSAGTAIVGSYAPNSWGLYDMHGNVAEWCLDWFENDVSACGGKVNINPANSQQLRSGNTPADRVTRGGSCRYVAAVCRSASRTYNRPNKRTDEYNIYGLRVVCMAGLQ